MSAIKTRMPCYHPEQPNLSSILLFVNCLHRTLPLSMTSAADLEDNSLPVHITGSLPKLPPPYSTIATFPPGSFLENLAVRRDGSILVSDMLSGSIWYINPHAEDGTTQATLELVHKFAPEDAQVEQSLAVDGPDEQEQGEGEGHGSYASTPAAEAIVESPITPDLFYLFSGVHGKKGTWWVYELDMRSFLPYASPAKTSATGQVATGVKVKRLAPVPAATWLNGGTAVPHRSEPLILMAESYQGRLYSYNIVRGNVDIWLEHALLGKMTTRPPWPGVNGVKYHHDGRDSWIYFTNSDRAILGRIKVENQDVTTVPARNSKEQVDIEILASGCGGDDLCIDGQGNIYVATNPMNTVLRFSLLAATPRASAGSGGTANAAAERRVILGLYRPQLSTEEASASQPKPGFDSNSDSDREVEVDRDTTGPTAVSFGATASDAKDLYVVTNGGIINPVDGVVREARLLRVHLKLFNVEILDA
ncbi:hypothetical protein AYO21_00484 [Fonsecaea monophora]|uniref:SMP-30/Gluconolactonase/LRE-like region domain-containing protein n=1 Tax=Fonsecaea monophora TaxID=254056 RepID=A0A177FN65_9EURO|nr:hypothetical protein AYO21_00484 [Fonsecaea monophora]OAG45136.1 hypothetical protein AYO21_00484 [Fonsecaea monophora]